MSTTLSKDTSAFYDRIRDVQIESGCRVVIPSLVLEHWYLETPTGRVLQGSVKETITEALWFAGLLTTGENEQTGFNEWFIRFPLPARPVQLSLFEDGPGFGACTCSIA
jgi:hypothetical protein